MIKDKVSTDGIFTISRDEADANSTITLTTQKEFSIWDLSQAVYTDCICDPQIEADTLHFKISTKVINTEFDISTDLSFTETIFAICDNIKV